MSNQQVARKRKDPLDFYETPPEAVHALMKVEKWDPPYCQVWQVWEPCAGNGAIVKALNQHGIGVLATDIVQRDFPLLSVSDFLQHDGEAWNCPYIITNPPYNQAEAFVRQALKCATTKVAMFMRIGFLESQGRYRMFVQERLAPTRVWVFSNRMNCDPTVQSSQVCYAWFVWDIGYIRNAQQLSSYTVPKTELGWITTLEGL